MQTLWINYFKVFRALIVEGWQIYKKYKGVTYYWVYPNTSLPTKWRLSEAYEISRGAAGLAHRFGITNTTFINFNILHTTETIWQEEVYGRGKA